jgi:hypothetical protein
MTVHHFDDLARGLAAGYSSRREALRRLRGGAIAVFGMMALTASPANAEGDGKRKKAQGGDIRAEAACIRTGRVCPGKVRGDGKVGCTRCCQGGSVRAPSARPGEVRKRRCCIAFGRSCTLDYGSTSSAAFCCVGVCLNGSCQAEPPPRPPCVAIGDPCPPGCDPAEPCAGCCTGECIVSGVCGTLV